MPPLLLTPPLSPIAALRRDTTALAQEIPPQAGGWMHLAQVLERVARHDDVEPLGEIGDAIALAGIDAPLPVLDAEVLADPRARAVQLVRGVTEAMEDAGMLWLADTLLASAERVADAALDRGRVEAHRARVAWKRGLGDEAAARYRRVLAMGRRHGLPELLARGWIGRVTLAQMRADEAEFARAARRALRESEAAGLAPMIALSHHANLVVASMQHQWSRALVHGWAAYGAARHDPVVEADRLINVAEVLRKAGRLDAARAGFLAALERNPPDRLRLPALGGLAMVEAARGARTAVRAAELEIRGIAAREHLPYQIADAYAELGAAHAMVGDIPRADTLLREARRRAFEHGFSPILERIDAIDRDRQRVTGGRPPARPRLTPAAEHVVAAVRALAA